VKSSHVLAEDTDASLTATAPETSPRKYVKAAGAVLFPSGTKSSKTAEIMRLAASFTSSVVAGAASVVVQGPAAAAGGEADA
jgi:hypothetical protein